MKKMFNKSTLVPFAIMATVIMLPVTFATAAEAIATDGSDTTGTVTNTATASAPSTDGGDSVGVVTNTTTVFALATDGDDTSGVVTKVLAPATDGDDTTGVVTNVPTVPAPTTDGDDTTGVITRPEGGSNNGGGSTSGGSGSSGRSSGGSSILLVAAAPSTCPLINSYLKLGTSNDPAEVTKLQSFLKNIEKIDVGVTGVFDENTKSAVETFQRKYLSDVMGPWGATKASGYVYITTKKMINKIACNSEFALSADDLAMINAYKARTQSPAGESTVETGASGSEVNTSGETASTTNGEIGSVNQNENVAAVGGSSFFSRFWSFLVNLFR